MGLVVFVWFGLDFFFLNKFAFKMTVLSQYEVPGVR